MKKQLIPHILFISCLYLANASAADVRTLSKVLDHIVESHHSEMVRLGHVQELLGKRYRRSIASTEIKHETFKKRHQKLVKGYLPKKYKDQYIEISQTIIEESLKYQMDPMFITAVIMSESSFNPLARGGVGEVGLMQILPGTGNWLADKVKIQWKGEKTLKNPILNIKLGSYYLAHLRGKYQHGQLYLAAYNMGPGNLKKALSRKIRPQEYTQRVMERYFELYKQIL